MCILNIRKAVCSWSYAIFSIPYDHPVQPQPKTKEQCAHQWKLSGEFFHDNRTARCFKLQLYRWTEFFLDRIWIILWQYVGQ